MWERRSRPVSGVKGWWTLGAWRRPSVARVSTTCQCVCWGYGIRRRECRVVGVDILWIVMDEGGRCKLRMCSRRCLPWETDFPRPRKWVEVDRPRRRDDAAQEMVEVLGRSSQPLTGGLSHGGWFLRLCLCSRCDEIGAEEYYQRLGLLVARMGVRVPRQGERCGAFRL